MPASSLRPGGRGSDSQSACSASLQRQGAAPPAAPQTSTAATWLCLKHCSARCCAAAADGASPADWSPQPSATTESTAQPASSRQRQSRIAARASASGPVNVCAGQFVPEHAGHENALSHLFGCGAGADASVQTHCLVFKKPLQAAAMRLGQAA